MADSYGRKRIAPGFSDINEYRVEDYKIRLTYQWIKFRREYLEQNYLRPRRLYEKT
jgi:hypothetical protein